jgi:hypothetical protein
MLRVACLGRVALGALSVGEDGFGHAAALGIEVECGLGYPLGGAPVLMHKDP